VRNVRISPVSRCLRHAKQLWRHSQLLERCIGAHMFISSGSFLLLDAPSRISSRSSLHRDWVRPDYLGRFCNVKRLQQYVAIIIATAVGSTFLAVCGSSHASNAPHASALSNCTPHEVTMSVVTPTSDAARQSLILQLTANGSTTCVIEGYPKLTPASNILRTPSSTSPTFEAVLDTRNGPLGGVFEHGKFTVVHVSAHHLAYALIEASPAGGPSVGFCGTFDRLAVQLPSSKTSIALDTSVSACERFQAHPFVGSRTGSIVFPVVLGVRRLFDDERRSRRYE
jgi:hypothetical protein